MPCHTSFPLFSKFLVIEKSLSVNISDERDLGVSIYFSQIKLHGRNIRNESNFPSRFSSLGNVLVHTVYLLPSKANSGMTVLCITAPYVLQYFFNYSTSR